MAASPARQTLQPEAIGAVMEAMKWLKSCLFRACNTAWKSRQTSDPRGQIPQGVVRPQERAPDYRVVAAWSGFLLFIGTGAFAVGMTITKRWPTIA
jgi:hypothetical protein